MTNENNQPITEDKEKIAYQKFLEREEKRKAQEDEQRIEKLAAQKAEKMFYDSTMNSLVANSDTFVKNKVEQVIQSGRIANTGNAQADFQTAMIIAKAELSAESELKLAQDKANVPPITSTTSTNSVIEPEKVIDGIREGLIKEIQQKCPNWTEKSVKDYIRSAKLK